MVARQKFGQFFQDRLKQIEQDAQACGINMSVVCREAGVGRATPDRWKRGELPKTVRVIEAMEAVIEKRKKAMEKQGRV